MTAETRSGWKLIRTAHRPSQYWLSKGTIRWTLGLMAQDERTEPLRAWVPQLGAGFPSKTESQLDPSLLYETLSRTVDSDGFVPASNSQT